MGASNPHPHSQVWASGHVPNEPGKELAAQVDHFNEYHRPLLAAVLAEEHKRKERILVSNDHFTALVPFWGIWPFEVLLTAHRPGLTRLTELSAAETNALAEILKAITTRYDNLFEISFPYSMGFHQAVKQQNHYRKRMYLHMPDYESLRHAHYQDTGNNWDHIQEGTGWAFSPLVLTRDVWRGAVKPTPIHE